jgi:tight adherence protein B
VTGLAYALAFAVCATLCAVLVVGAIRTAADRYGASVRAVAEEGLADLFIFVSPARLRAISAVLVVAMTLATGLAGGSPVAAVAAGFAGLAAPALLRRWLRRRRERALLGQLPDALAALAGALRAGLGLSQAIGTVAAQQPSPIRHEFALLLRKQRLGMPLDRALEELAVRTPGAEFRMFVTVARIARELGGTLSESLDRLAETLRRKRAMEDRIDALTSQGRLQGWIVGLLPLLLMVVLHELEPGAMRPMFTTPAGWAVLTVLAVLLGVGALLIRKIVRIDV